MGHITPERYSHDTLRDRLQTLKTIELLFDNELEGCDSKGVKRLWDKHKQASDDFKKSFDEHDVEMQFVDKIIKDLEKLKHDMHQKDAILGVLKEKDEKAKKFKSGMMAVLSIIATLVGIAYTASRFL